MTVFIDADGCPVVDIAVREAKKLNIENIIVSDTAHDFSNINTKVITVDCEKDSADMKIVSLIKQGDIVITQDYGLAALCLAKNVIPLNQNGTVYTNSNIEAMLFSRYEAAKLRKSGKHLKGPAKRTADDDRKFTAKFRNLLIREGLTYDDNITDSI